MRQKHLVLALLTVFAVGLLGACGPTSAATPAGHGDIEEKPTGQPAPAAEPTAAAERVKVVWLMWPLMPALESADPAIQAIFDAAEE